MNDLDDHSLFWRLHAGLPRQAPGSDATTEHLLEMAQPLPAQPDVLDVGCGPGRSVLVLAHELPGARVMAVDTHQPFLDELDAAAVAGGCADRIVTLRAQMQHLPFDECSFDLVWSEGAVYVMGFATGLRAWRPLVRPAGLVVVTEATWFTDAPSARARSFWADAYPAMTDVTTNERIAAQAGYQVIGTHRLADHANSTATTVTSTATPGSCCDASTDRSTVGLGPIRRGSSARAWSGRRR